jgi:hypothetical protein
MRTPRNCWALACIPRPSPSGSGIPAPRPRWTRTRPSSRHSDERPQIPPISCSGKGEGDVRDAASGQMDNRGVAGCSAQSTRTRQTTKSYRPSSRTSNEGGRRPSNAAPTWPQQRLSRIVGRAVCAGRGRAPGGAWTRPATPDTTATAAASEALTLTQSGWAESFSCWTSLLPDSESRSRRRRLRRTNRGEPGPELR